MDPRWMQLTPEEQEQFGTVFQTQTQAFENGGQMCWLLEWFKEDLPLENKAGTATVEYVQAVLDDMYAASPTSEEYIGDDVPLHAPQFDMPPPPKKMNILVFMDKYGYCQGILDNAPDGRIGKAVKVDNWRDYGLEDEDGREDLQIVGSLIGKKPWDLILFGPPCEIPKSNDVEHIIEFQDKVAKLALAIVKYLVTTENSTKKLCVLTRNCFSDDPEFHKTVGLSACTSSLFYGFCNTARQELEECAVQYLDTEYFLKPPFWDTNDYQLLPRLASEVFREQTFGASAVRILNSGRYVAKQVSAKPYAQAGIEFEMPAPGDIVGIGGGNGALGIVMGYWLVTKAKREGCKDFKIHFLSRSMKIADINMPLWKEVEKLAEELGIECTPMKIDLSSQQGCDKYVDFCEGKLFGFIHSAGILADSMISNMTWEKFEEVWGPKHRVGLRLHKSLEKIPNKLKFLWMFSSTSTYGNMGQLNYSASNAMLDGLSRHRRAIGLPSQTQQWGAWGEAGMAASLDAITKRRFESGPFPPFTNVEGMRGLDEGLATGSPTFSVFKANPQVVMGMLSQADPNTANFYSDQFPSLPLEAKPENAYSILRQAGYPYGGNPNREALMWNCFVKPLIPEEDDEGDQAPGAPTSWLTA